MRITLINPPPRTEADRHWSDYPFLGVAYVAASLRARGHDVAVLDGKLGRLGVSDIRRKVPDTRPDLVGITCMTLEFPTTRQIADGLRADGFGGPIALGGAHVNAVGQQALAECESADFACIGEGEDLAPELCDAITGNRSFTDICGLAYRADGLVTINEPREYRDDYDSVPFPAWDLFDTDDVIPLLTHRGCPFQCNFCGHNSGFKPRYRSPANVLDEIGWVIARFRPQTIRIEDETFGLNPERTREILHGIIERGYNHSTRFSAQTRVDRVEPYLVRLLKLCNFVSLELGVESGNPEILARMGKRITLAEVERAVALAKRERLHVWCKFIIGHPYETPKSARDTAKFIARINPDQISVSIMTPFPGTPIFDMAVRGEGGYRLLAGDWSDFDKYTSGVLELETLSLAQLKWYQIRCYLELYLRNRRYGDLALLAISNRRLVTEMAVQLARAPRKSRRLAPDPPGATRPDGGGATTPLSNVAMPDSTLVSLRRAATRNESITRPRDELRTWASPGG